MKILCPYHDDTNPSAKLYEDGHAYCFVCCKAWRPVGAKATKTKKVPPEDLQATIAEILKMPKRRIRGLEFHANDKGYYVLWPDLSYYKCRLANPIPSGGKYLCPRGHTQPLLIIDPAGFGGTLAIIEGEINALSVATAAPDLRVVSPGSAGNFKAQEDSIVSEIQKSDRVVIWCDDDQPGLTALMETAALARGLGKDTSWIFCAQDANILLECTGAYSIVEKIKGAA